jgi:hypothetical protein
MKFLNWKTASIAITVLILAVTAILVVPAIGQDQKKDKPPVGLEQAQQLTEVASRAMKEGNYKDAVHALHSASFILEEGCEMHGGGPGMPPGGMDGMRGGMNGMPGMGPMGGPEMGPGPWGGPGGGQMGAPHDFPSAVERTKHRIAELKNMGGDIGDVEAKLDAAQKTFDSGKEQDAWKQMKEINDQLDKVRQGLKGNEENLPDQPKPHNEGQDAPAPDQPQ